MTVRQVLLLGNPALHKVCAAVENDDVGELCGVIADLHDTLMDFRAAYGAGRAIAAPQIGVMKRIVYMHIDQPVVLFNPVIDQRSQEMIAVWDDCMSFPDLLVKVLRHRSCRITYRTTEWQTEQLTLEADLSELLQHECDHLDGVLAVSRAIDGQSFALRSQRALVMPSKQV